MSRITSDKISLADSIVVDFFSHEEEEQQQQIEEQAVEEEVIPEEEITRLNLLQLEAQDKAQKIIEEANQQAQEILDKARLEADELKLRAQDDTQKLKNEASELLEKTKAEVETMLEGAKGEVEQIKETASQTGAEEGYQAGYDDGLKNIKEELVHKIFAMDKVIKNAFEMKKKIFFSSKREMVELILMIARKVALNSIDETSVARIVDKSISLLNDKENIELILSEKYAKLLNQVLNNDLLEQKPDLEIDIDKLRSIKLTYNSKFADDTLIVQTPKERLDLGFESQLDEISKEFLKELNLSFDKEDEEEFEQV